MAGSTGSVSFSSSASQMDFANKAPSPRRRPLQWTNSLPRKYKKQPGEWNYYEKTESCYDLTTLDFEIRKEESRTELVRTQSGLIVPPRKKKQDKMLDAGKTKQKSQSEERFEGRVVRSQSGQIVPPRVKTIKSQNNVNEALTKNVEQKEEIVSLSSGRNKIPPTPPKRKRSINAVQEHRQFKHWVNCNEQQYSQINKKSTDRKYP